MSNPAMEAAARAMLLELGSALGNDLDDPVLEAHALGLCESAFEAAVSAWLEHSEAQEVDFITMDTGPSIVTAVRWDGADEWDEKVGRYLVVRVVEDTQE